MKLLWAKFFPILFLLLLSVIFFLPYLLGNKIPYVGDFTGSDLTELNLPFRYLVKESFLDGQVPLWTNLLSNGFPLLAEGQAGVFYPLNILFVLLPFVTAVNLSFFLNFFLSGLFTYLYSKILKISQFGSILAAVAFSFSGFFVFRIKHLNLINAAIWLPLEFYLIEKYFSAKKKSFVVIALSVVFAVQFFAGHPQISYISLVSCFLYFLLRLYFSRECKFNKKLIQPISFWLVVGLITFGICAIQFLPSYEFTKISNRQSWISYQNITLYKYHPANLLNFISPYLFGNFADGTYKKDIREFGVPWESNIYFGILSLFFSFLAIIFLWRKDKNVKIFIWLLVIAFLFSLGDFNPLFVLFYWFIPGFNIFRFPQRFLLLALLSLVVLSGFGFDFFWQKVNSWQEKKKKEIKSRLLFKTLLPALIILIVCVDLFIVAFNYVGFLNYSNYFTKPESVKFLEKDEDDFKILSFRWMDSWQKIYELSNGWQNNLSLFVEGRNLLPPNLNVFWNIPSVDDRGIFEGGLGSIARFSKYQGILLADSRSFNEDSEITFSSVLLKLLGLQNVKYLLSFLDLGKTEGLSLAKEISSGFLPPLKVYENVYFLPRAVAFFKTELIQDPEDILQEIFNIDFDPSVLILEKDTGYQNPDHTINQAKIEIVEDHASNIIINTDFNREGFLYLSNIYFPGWHAEIDSQSTEILRANYTFTALRVPAGKHQVRLFFLPLSYVVGKWLTTITVLSLLAFLMINIGITKKPKIQTRE